MEGRVLFNGILDEGLGSQLLICCEKEADAAPSVAERITYLLNAAYLADKRLGLRRKALKVGAIR
jgi:hypothetical protein